MQSVLQIRSGNGDNFGIIFPIFCHKNIYCDPLLELSRGDSYNEGSQYMLSVRSKKIFPQKLTFLEFCTIHMVIKKFQCFQYFYDRFRRASTMASLIQGYLSWHLRNSGRELT